MKKIALLLIIILASCEKKPAPAVIPAYPVKTEIVSVKSVPIYIDALGHVDSITSIQIRSRIEGELTGIFFTQGQDVKRGDLLFTIDPRPYEAALKASQGTLEENLANLALAEEKVKRYTKLAKDEYYSQLDFETLQANVSSLKGVVEQNKAQVEANLINLNYCWIYAPINGKMGILQVDLGNLVRDDGTNLVMLNQMEPIYVTFSVPEFQLPSIQKYNKGSNLTVQAAYENFAEETFTGELFALDNEVNADTGMIKLRAVFENARRELWPGQFIRTRLVLYISNDAVVIPYNAVQLTQNGPVIFVVKDDKTVDQRNVVLGPRQDAQIIVNKGISAGERIVIDGQLNLYPGAKVK